MMKQITIAVVVLTSLISVAMAGDIGFIEDYALAKDRSASLKSLIPGTEDYYYFHCLHYLQLEQYEKAEETTRPWLARFGQTPRLLEIQLRHALLTYDKNSQRSLDFLKEKMNLRFDHQKEVPGAVPNLPTVLDPKFISRDNLRALSMERWKNLDNFSDHALDWLATENLDATRRRHLLQRLTRPDIPNLPKLIVDDLNAPDSPVFGTYPIHKQLTLTQLNELVELKPELLNQNNLVNTWLIKLQPNADEDWRHDSKPMLAFLDRLWAFASRLNQTHHSLKAHILYHRLALDRTLGLYDQARFIEYLKLPRQQPYMSQRWLERDEARRFPADLKANFEALTLLPPVGSDEPLVRSYLKHFLIQAPSTKEFEPFINDIYLKRLFAETKIEYGLGEPEQWASSLTPELYQQLKERVDIDFAYTNAQQFKGDDPVTLDLFIKNVPSLLVRVFEINTASYYREHKKEIDTDINLDGLVPSEELTVKITESPFRRVPRRIELPRLKQQGVYVVDFIGAGKSSRALIRKGRLRPLVTTGSMGQVVTVIDEANRKVLDSRLWLNGQEFAAEKDGLILVPFSTQPGTQPIILSKGDFACLDTLEHAAESYRLTAGIHIERESLLAQRIAKVLIRPNLSLNGQPIGIRRLEEVKLRLTSTDHDGIASTLEVADFKLFEDRESAHEFRVPERLGHVHVELIAKVKNQSLSKLVDVIASQGFALNGIDKSERILDLHLAKHGEAYFLEVRGRTGELKPDATVDVSLTHHDFKERIQVALKSDQNGVISLGSLPSITSLTATMLNGANQFWDLTGDQHSYRSVMHARQGEPITLPYLGKAQTPTRSELALFEMKNGSVVADHFAAMSLKNGLIEITGLPHGDYELILKDQNERIQIQIVRGNVEAGFVLGRARQLELPRLKPVQIESITPNGKDVAIKLHDASPFARLHVFVTRYKPANSAFRGLGSIDSKELAGTILATASSNYLVKRDIGDEYRYVLDRNKQKKYAGNMLERPQLLINPWAMRLTETTEQLAKAGSDYEKIEELTKRLEKSNREEEKLGTTFSYGEGGGKSTADRTSNLDFFADAALVAINLIPNKDGLVNISTEGMNTHGWIHVIAVDPLNTTYRSMSLPQKPARILDLRLHSGLDPQSHFTQQKQVDVLSTGQPFVINDITSSRFETYDSLGKVYTLYLTLSKDPKLAEFSFIITWSTLKAEEKRKLYSKYACHELSFFLKRKDPDFFVSVIKPYLVNKKDKTFLDHWLLESDLSSYQEPWQYARLNVMERILLAQRLTGEKPIASRQLNDQWRMLPPNLDRSRMLFETAIKARALDSSDPAKAKLAEIEKNYRRPLLYLMSNGAPAGRDGKDDKPLGNALDSISKSRATTGQVRDLAQEQLEARKEERGVALKLKKDVDDQKTVARRGFIDFDGSIRGKPDDERSFYDTQGLGVTTLARQLYRKVEPTQELVENNYYQLPIQQQLAGLVTVNGFWLDYSQNDGKTPFLTRHLPQASTNFTEMMFALAVLDLPFTPGKHDIKFDGPKMTFTPAGPVIVFHEEIKPAAAAQVKTPILLSQNFYRPSDRYREENGEKLDHFIADEFLTGTVYGCQVVVTNPTSSRQKLTALIQLPVGAMPLANGQQTKLVPLDLEAYRTQTIDYLFYFPKPGKFAHLPVNVGKNELFLISAPPATFEVVEKVTRPDTQSWDYVSQNGTNEEVLAFLNRENVESIHLKRIAFRMKDKTFFEGILTLLTGRHLYQPTLWSYSLYHNNVPRMREYLRHADALIAQCGNGPMLSTPLVIDPVERHLYEHLEYKPLLNARAHALGQRRQIVNDRLSEQYHRFLKVLSYKKQMDDSDLLAVTYYLLVQDRIEEALETFGRVNANKLATMMQYDYCSAYLAFFTEETVKARTIAAKYTNHPVDKWKNTFAVITTQLDEIEGKAIKAADADDRNQRQAVLAAGESSYDFTIDAKKINLTWQNIQTVRVNYYLMDVELLFSRNPFVQQYGSQFSAIKPNHSQDVSLPSGQRKLAIDLPKELANRNVLVEIVAGGKSRSLPYYANALEVTLQDNYGQLKVVNAATSKPLPKVYVKVYARLADGSVKYHKDGYTDLRGKFDYASVSTPEKSSIARFSILVLSDEFGAMIKETNPPAQ